MLDPKIEEALANGIKDTMWMCFWKGEQKANLEELEDSCKRLIRMTTHNAEELEKYPKFKQAYIRAFQRIVDNMDGIRNETWTDGEAVYKWWLQK